MSLGQNNASQDLELTQVWYAGTTTLKEGQPVVYDNDDTNAPVLPTDTLITGNEAQGQINFQARKNLRGRRVIDPVSTAKASFAGLVEASSAGVTGPAMITIVKPIKGTVATALTKANCTKNSTILSVDSAGPSVNLIADSSTVGTPTTTTLYDQVAVALETKDTSATAGPTLVRFL